MEPKRAEPIILLLGHEFSGSDVVAENHINIPKSQGATETKLSNQRFLLYGRAVLPKVSIQKHIVGNSTPLDASK